MPMRISLTFDDGPNIGTTVHVLELLEKYKIQASFFLIGQNINEKSAESMRRQIDDGCTIECHSWTHPAFPDLTAEQMIEEVEKTNAAIEKYSGQKPQFFRPPYIALNQLMYDTIKMPFIQGFGVSDWDDAVSVEYRVTNIMENVHDGQIILLHDSDGNEKTVETLRQVIPALLSKGVQFYTVRKLFEVCGVNPHVPNKIWTDLF